jgi:glycosyltransferase involved in cell wall biosynthesis
MKILFPYMARWYALNWSRYHSLLVALAQRGHEVHVMQPPALRSAETNFQEIAATPVPGLFVHEVSVPSWLWRTSFPFDKLVKKALYSVYSVRTAHRLARQHNVSHVLLYNIPQWRLVNIPGTRTVFDFADDYLDMLKHELGRWAHPWIMGLARRMLSHMFRNASLTTTVSNVLAHQVNECPVTVVPNGVSVQKAQSALARIQHAAGDRPVVGFLGSFEYFIDFDLILDVAQRLPQCDFVLVGRGRDQPYIEAQIAQRQLKNVRLPGGVPHAEVFNQIGRMDICLNIFKKVPVSERACPIKLFEYASMRKPIVSTRLAELEFVDAGFLYYGDTADEVAACVQQILANPQEARLRAARGYDHVMMKYAQDFERALGVQPTPA